MADRWMSTISYEVMRLDGKYHVMRRGGKYVGHHVPDEEVSYQSVAVAADYDAAIDVLRALRTTLAGGDDA